MFVSTGEFQLLSVAQWSFRAGDPRFCGAKRPPPTATPTGKGGGLRPPPFPVSFAVGGGRLDPKIDDVRPGQPPGIRISFA